MLIEEIRTNGQLERMSNRIKYPHTRVIHTYSSQFSVPIIGSVQYLQVGKPGYLCERHENREKLLEVVHISLRTSMWWKIIDLLVGRKVFAPPRVFTMPP